VGSLKEARTLRFDSNALRNDLARLRTADWRFALFGAETHSYQFHSPLPEETVAAFEREHEVTLPEDYRQFLGHETGVRLTFCTWHETGVRLTFCTLRASPLPIVQKAHETGVRLTFCTLRASPLPIVQKASLTPVFIR
jgi:hypothetical protein